MALSSDAHVADQLGPRVRAGGGLAARPGRRGARGVRGPRAAGWSRSDERALGHRLRLAPLRGGPPARARRAWRCPAPSAALPATRTPTRSRTRSSTLCSAPRASGTSAPHFPDTDERWRDADSIGCSRDVARVARRARRLGPVNVDATVRLRGAEARPPPRRDARAPGRCASASPRGGGRQVHDQRGNGLRRAGRGDRRAGDRHRRRGPLPSARDTFRPMDRTTSHSRAWPRQAELVRDGRGLARASWSSSTSSASSASTRAERLPDRDGRARAGGRRPGRRAPGAAATTAPLLGVPIAVKDTRMWRARSRRWGTQRSREPAARGLRARPPPARGRRRDHRQDEPARAGDHRRHRGPRVRHHPQPVGHRTARRAAPAAAAPRRWPPACAPPRRRPTARARSASPPRNCGLVGLKPQRDRIPLAPDPPSTGTA